jgi:hypothetical protein
MIYVAMRLALVSVYGKGLNKQHCFFCTTSNILGLRLLWTTEVVLFWSGKWIVNGEVCVVLTACQGGQNYSFCLFPFRVTHKS